MTGFYSYLKRGFSKDQALQKSKLDYLSTATQLRAHPYFWSAYVNIGNSKPLEKSQLLNYVIYASILALFVVVFWFRKRKKPS